MCPGGLKSHDFSSARTVQSRCTALRTPFLGGGSASSFVCSPHINRRKMIFSKHRIPVLLLCTSFYEAVRPVPSSFARAAPTDCRRLPRSPPHPPPSYHPPLPSPDYHRRSVSWSPLARRALRTQAPLGSTRSTTHSPRHSRCVRPEKLHVR